MSSDLTEYEEVEKWLSTVKESSARDYKTAIRLYTEFTGLNPTQLIDEAEEDRKKPRREQGKPEYRLTEFYKYLLNDYEKHPLGMRRGSKKKGVSKMRARSILTSLRSFYKRNGFTIMTKSPKAAPKKENKKLSLTPKDVKLLADHAPTIRDRAIILMIFQGGFDVSTICSLNYGDVSREFRDNKAPMLIQVVREKEEVEYFTCVGHDTVEALKAYLNDRRRKGGELNHNSPLFAKEGAKKLSNERITTNLIQNMLKDTALRSGIVSEDELEHSDVNPCRPHALRSAFSTILRLNGFDPLLVDFMQGHAIPYNGAYLIPPEEKVRQMYAEVEPQLSVSGVSPVEKKLDERLKAYREDIVELQEENRDLREQLEKLQDKVTFLLEQYEKDKGETTKEIDKALEEEK